MENRTRFIAPSRSRRLVPGRWLAAALLLAGLLAARPGRAQSDDATITPIFAAANEPWVATWASGQTNPANDVTFLKSSYNGTDAFNNQTIRLIVHVSLGGKKLRVRLSNEQGSTPVNIGGARVALSAGQDAIVDGTSRSLTFGGQTATILPAGAPLLSDPVSLDVPDGGNLAISIYLSAPVTVTSAHTDARQTNYVAAAGTGDTTASLTLPLDATNPTITQWPLLTGVEVKAPGASAIVTFGSSITNGVNSTTDANARWPDVLARRLYKRGLAQAVVNPSIPANRFLFDSEGQNALARFDRDVLGRPGAKYVVVSDIAGVDALSGGSTSDQIIAGLEQVILRAHSANLRIIGSTILPVYGFIAYSDAGEAKRQAINAFIRTTNLFDGVVDFDVLIRDPAMPIRINPALDSGDHHHPNDAGYAIMGEALPLTLFQ